MFKKCNWEVFEKSILNLKEAGVKNINAHVILSKETLCCIEAIFEHKDSEVVKSLNAVVLLSLKQCGRGKNFTPLTQQEFTEIIKRFIQEKIPFGADSCSACKMIKAFKELDLPVPYESILPCESALESCYCSVDGTFYPCSFNEKEQYAVKCSKETNFIRDVWNSEQFKTFRKLLLNNDRNCPSYRI